METKWYCFLFWFSYRFTLACLGHFNWAVSIYTNCAYFTLWKSYDLLWFWMHFILCSCFPQLRPENYLIVWANLIIKKCTKYPDYTYKQLYYALYSSNRSVHFTKRLMTQKRAKGVIDIESNSDDEEALKEQESARTRTKFDINTNGDDAERNEGKIEICNDVPQIHEKSIIEKDRDLDEDEKNFNEDEEYDENEDANESTPLRPPRPSRVKINMSEDDDQLLQVEKTNDDSNNSSSPQGSESKKTWISFVPQKMMKFMPRQSSTASLTSKASDQGTSTSAFSRLYGRLRNRKNSIQNEPSNEIDVLRPDFTNTHDIKDKAKRDAREKRDRKALRARIRRELRMQMKLDAENERKFKIDMVNERNGYRFKGEKKVTDAIELLLQLLRMQASFAMLIGTIRKTFIPAQFKYLRPGQHAYDNYELIILFRCTAFLDIAMFWMNVSYAYCLQWQLCCKLGLKRFVFWAFLLGVLSVGAMFIPMMTIMDDLDLSWCRFRENTTFAKYQPKW